MTTPTRESDRLTIQDVIDMLDTAGYGGINYWATTATVKLADPTDDGQLARALPPDTVAYSVLPEDGPRVHITLGALLDSWDVFTAAEQPHVNETIHGYFRSAVADPQDLDLGCIDAWAADVWVQLAAFGEVVYG